MAAPSTQRAHLAQGAKVTKVAKIGCFLVLATTSTTSFAATRLGRPNLTTNELKKAADLARRELQTHGNIEFFTRDNHDNWTLIEPSNGGTPSPSAPLVTSAESANPEGAGQPRPQVLCIATKPDQSIQSWVFPLGNELTELIESAAGYGVIDTKNASWKAIIEKKFKAGKSLMEEVSVGDHEGRIIDQGKRVSLTARRRDEPTPVQWTFAAKNLRDLTSFDFERVLEHKAAYDADKLLPNVNVLDEWPEQGMNHPAFFKQQLKELKKRLDSPTTTVTDLGNAFKGLSGTYSISLHAGTKHWLANERWDWAFENWWREKAIQQYKGEASAMFLMQNASTMPYRELLSVTGFRLPWLDDLVTKVAGMKKRWHAFDKGAHVARDYRARFDFTALWTDLRQDLPERKEKVLQGFDGLLSDQHTTLDQLVDFILSAESELNHDGRGRRVLYRARTFTRWLEAGKGLRGHTHWLSADYVETHRNSKTLLDLETNVSNVRTFVDDLVTRMLQWARENGDGSKN